MGSSSALERDNEEINLAMIASFELTTLVTFVLGMVYYYRAPLVPTFISATVFLSWYLGFTGTLLLPADIADDVIRRGSSPWVLNFWLTIYWTTFILAWIVLPILNTAWHEGEFTWRRRLESAARSNLRQYIVMGAASLAFIIYLLVSGKTHLTSLSGFLMAWGNTYGLMLIVLLLGHGLVEVPRKLWQNSFPDRELRLLYFRASQVDMDLHDAICELDDAEHDVDRMEHIVERDLPHAPVERECMLINLIAVRATRDAFAVDTDRIRRTHTRGGSGGSGGGAGGGASSSGGNGSGNGGGVSNSSTPVRGSINGGGKWEGGDGHLRATQRCLVKLHSRLRSSQEKVAATRQKWDTLLQRVDAVEVIVAGALPYPTVERGWFKVASGSSVSDNGSGGGAGGSGGGSGNGSGVVIGGGGGGVFGCISSCFLLVGARLVWYWRMHWGGWCQRGLAAVFGALSAMIVWSEIVIGLQDYVNLSPFGAVLRLMDGDDGLGAVHPLLLQSAALVPFLYMSICCYRSLFKLRLFSNMALQGPHQSLPGPLLVNAQYLIRLQFPLGYNFLQIVGYSGRDGTAFQRLMSNMQVVPILGTGFQVYAPLAMVLLCVFTLCKGYARMLRFLGLEHEDLASEDDPDGKERLEEGRKLIDRSRRAAALREKRRAARDAGGLGSGIGGGCGSGGLNGSGGGNGGTSSGDASPTNSGLKGYLAPSVAAGTYGRLRTMDIEEV